jgi:hypothetical protein
MTETDTIRKTVLEIVSVTDKGPRRQNNEDYVAVVFPDDDGQAGDSEIAAGLEGSLSLDQAVPRLVQAANRSDNGDSVLLVIAKANGCRTDNGLCSEGYRGRCFHPSPQEDR